MSRKLVCESCGSTDIEILERYYKCNYCHTTHILPTYYHMDSLEEKNIQSGFIKSIVSASVGIVMLVYGIRVWYAQHQRTLAHQRAQTSDTAQKLPTLIQPEPKDTTKPKPSNTPASALHISPQEGFPNLLISHKSLKSIRLFKKISNDRYMVVGNGDFNEIKVLILDSKGKKVRSDTLGEGFRSDAVIWPNGEIVLSYNYLRNGEVVKFNNLGERAYRLHKYFKAIEPLNEGVVGISGGTIEALRDNGETLWKKEIETKKVLRKTGKKRDESTGKTVVARAMLPILELTHMVKLGNGNYAAVGMYDRSQVAIVVFDSTGDILSYHKSDMGRIYIDAITATGDGGFALVARKGLQFFKYDGDGNLVLRKKIALKYPEEDPVYSYTIVEDESGYIITSSVDQEARLQILRIDYDGNILSKQQYRKRGVRLHPEFLVPYENGEYLMAVNTEISDSWIVRVLPNGRMDANVDDPTLRAEERANVSYMNDIHSGALASSAKTYNFKSDEQVSTSKVPTITIPSGRITQFEVSTDGKWLYGITSSTGFRIYNLDNDKPRLVTTILRTRSKLRIEPHYIGPTDGKPPKKHTPYDYDSPLHFEISKDDTRAYVSDRNHGFYIVDISDKSHPKILVSISAFTPDSFLLSDDERYIILHAKGRLLRVQIDSLSSDRVPAYHNDSRRRAYMLYDKDKMRIIVSKEKELMVYDANTLKLISTYTRKERYGLKLVTIGSDNKIYAGYGANKIAIWQLHPDSTITSVTDMSMSGYVESIIPLPEPNRFCYGQKGGLTCVDYTDTLNPKRYIRYSDTGLNLAGTATITGDKLVISYSYGGIGVVKIEK